MILFEAQRGNLFWTLVIFIFLITHEKLLANWNKSTFSFSSRLHSIFLSFHFFVTLLRTHENHSKEFMQSVFYHLMNSFVENFLMKNSWKPFSINRATKPFFSSKRSFAWTLFLDDPKPKVWHVCWRKAQSTKLRGFIS